MRIARDFFAPGARKLDGQTEGATQIDYNDGHKIAQGILTHEIIYKHLMHDNS